MNEFVNLTRSDLRIIDDDGHEFVIPKSGDAATVRRVVRSMYKSDGMPIAEVDYVIDGMPPNKGMWVVSWKALMVAKAMGWDVSDLYAPDMFIRDAKGYVTGARSLVRLA